jgi:hypothetical protein
MVDVAGKHLGATISSLQISVQKLMGGGLWSWQVPKKGWTQQ